MIGGKKQEAPKTYFVSVCNSCGKTAHISRRFCSCGAELGNAKSFNSSRPPDNGPCNFETRGLSCNDCPEDCLPCAGHGIPQTDFSGFGGKGCRYRVGSARCYCCQQQVEIAIKLGTVEFSEIISEVMAKRRADGGTSGKKNIFLEAADVIREEMTKPVLARIQRYEEASLGVPIS
jgi:hypothetical protein